MRYSLKRFKHFVAYVKNDAELAKLVESINLFRFDEKSEIWIDEQDSIVSDLKLATQMSMVRREEVYWREKLSTAALLDVPTYSAIARATFSAPPRKKSLERVYDKIEEAVERAGHAFDAVHDSMTGLLNAKGFDDAAFGMTWVAAPAEQSAGGPATTEPAVVAAVSIFALDIDHFKQVNDTYGHTYGDVVIQCVAQRLDRFETEKAAASGGNLSITAARPSGEEFMLMLVGRADAAALIRLADDLRASVSDGPLPSDDEWELFASQEAKKAGPPPLVQRRVTVSIGIASAPVSGTRGLRQKNGKLRSHADLALYSAKGAGRNAVHHFDDILLAHGHVLEHHPETGIVAIDIGRRVGVPLGQEFHVLHPQFTGNVPFLRSDGRTNKKWLFSTIRG